MTPEQLVAHKRVMALPPVEYRDYRIQVVSHMGQPYFVGGRAHYWGFIVVHASGPFEGCNAGPGAAWSETVGEAKTIIDCLHEAGSRPSPEAGESEHIQWSKRFWSLMNERRLYERGDD
jgi:hypothetical protein